MKTKIKTVTLLLWSITVGQVFGQITYLPCHIHTVSSQNDNYFLRTIPFDMGIFSTGKTVVFSSDSSKIYEIGKYFWIRNNANEIFLSNDGKTVIYVRDREFERNGVPDKCIEIFKNGLPFKQFGLTDLIDCDSDMENCFLFYKEAIDTIIILENYERKTIYKENATDFEKKLTKKATFLNNDTLYVFANTNKFITIDINTVNLTVSPYIGVDEEWFNQIKPIRADEEWFTPLPKYDFPYLSNGKSLEKTVAKHLDMAIFPHTHKAHHKYKKYSIYVGILVDKFGKAFLDTINVNGKFQEDQIKTFIELQEFTIRFIPKETEMWRFVGTIDVMNKNKKEAKREKQQEQIEETEAYKKRVMADSINEFYIPKNLEECFIELNKLLKPEVAEAVKSLKDRDETIRFHHGLGTWLRNNWGLWGGSRLQQYLLKKGINHPDGMSASILKFYYDWLNEQHDEWRAFEAK